MQSSSFLGIPIILLLIHGIVAEQLYTSSGVSFGQNSHEPKYYVEYHHLGESPYHPENDQELIPMTESEGKKYHCYLPIVEERKTVKTIVSENSTHVVIENERRIKPKHPDELLDVLKDQCFYRHENWWSYEFCFHGKLRQVHIENEKVVQEYILGEYDPEATAAYIYNQTGDSLLIGANYKDASLRYHAHLYTNGTICDLTDVPRETEVRFMCGEPSVMILSIKEISSCKYVLAVQAPMLCKNPMFQQKRPTWTIHCNEIFVEKEEGMEKPAGTGIEVTVLTEESESYAT